MPAFRDNSLDEHADFFAELVQLVGRHYRLPYDDIKDFLKIAYNVVQKYDGNCTFYVYEKDGFVKVRIDDNAKLRQ